MLLYLEARSKKTSSKGSTKITSIKHLNDIEVFSIIHFETEKKKLNKYQFFLASISIDLAIGFKRAAGDRAGFFSEDKIITYAQLLIRQRPREPVKRFRALTNLNQDALDRNSKI